jgi:hypothetical protein
MLKSMVCFLAMFTVITISSLCQSQSDTLTIAVALEDVGSGLKNLDPSSNEFSSLIDQIAGDLTGEVLNRRVNIQSSYRLISLEDNIAVFASQDASNTSIPSEVTLRLVPNSQICSEGDIIFSTTLVCGPGPKISRGPGRNPGVCPTCGEDDDVTLDPQNVLGFDLTQILPSVEFSTP